MGYAVAKQIILEEQVCITCGVDYAIPKQLYDSHRRIGGYHHCPNGHQQGWDKGSDHTRIKELERQLSAEQERKQAALTRANEERQRAEKAEAEIKRQAKRSKAGVCPCCNRTFQQLARHMASKHTETPNGK